MDKPAVKQLDHVIARTPDAASLHRLFSETLQPASGKMALNL